jgi:large subunit ribosomal protein L31
MKKDIHPQNYRTLIFHDNSRGERFLVGSTIETTTTDKWKDGKEYPVTYVDVSSASHPFYTGQEKVMDTAGRVERFKARMEAKGSKGGKKRKA